MAKTAEPSTILKIREVPCKEIRKIMKLKLKKTDWNKETVESVGKEIGVVLNTKKQTNYLRKKMIYAMTQMDDE